MKDVLRDKLHAACSIAYNIPGLRRLPHHYRKDLPHTAAGFIDDFTLIKGGHGDIDVCIIGLANLGREISGKAENDVLIAFRGTSFSLLDWLNDCKANQVDSPYAKGKVHHGFLESVQNLEKPVLENLEELLKDNPEAKIYLTGHSKGGAMATLMGLSIASNHPEYRDRIIVATFGSPRVGDNEFFDDYSLEHHRYESFLDLVPHLPFSEQEGELILKEHPHLSKHSIFKDFHFLPPYKHVGKRRAFKQLKDRPEEYLDLPLEPEDAHEGINSFHAIVSSIHLINPKSTAKLIADVHVFDYFEIPDGV